MLRELYDDVCPPGQGEVFGLATSATAARYRVPPTWPGNMVTFVSLTDNLYVLFGGPGVKVDAAAVSATIATGEFICSDHSHGFIVPAGVPMTWPVGENISHFSIVASGATGKWCAAKSSGSPNLYSPIPPNLDPLLYFDAANRRSLNLTSGAVTVDTWKSLGRLGINAIPGNKPDLLDATATSSGLITPGVSFVSGSSESLSITDATIAAALSGGNPFSVFLAVRRTAAGAAHTLLSLGTTGTDNSRWDVTLDASDDFVFTVVDSGGTSATYTYTATYSAGFYLLTLTFPGTSAPSFWSDRTTQTLTAGGTLGSTGTATKLTIGARAYNTSTIGQYASAELGAIIIADRAWNTAEVDALHLWAAHRFGK